MGSARRCHDFMTIILDLNILDLRHKYFIYPKLFIKLPY